MFEGYLPPYNHLLPLNTKCARNTYPTGVWIKYGSKTDGIILHLAKYNAFVSTAIMVDKMLIGLCQTINSGIHDLIVIADIVSLVLNKNLEKRVKKDVRCV